MSFVCLYVDNSNIFLEGRRFARKHKHENRNDLRVYFRNFLTLIVQGRPLREAVWGGSVPPRNDAVWDYLRKQSIEPDLIPRASTGEHETIDYRLQLLMHRHVREYRQTPGIIALATGDGKGYDKKEGFLYDVEGFVSDGWQLEIYSWSHSCSRALRSFAEGNGKFIKLDEYYDQITFIKNWRVVNSL